MKKIALFVVGALFVFMGCTKSQNQNDSYTSKLLEEAGVIVEDVQREYSDEFAESVINRLVTSEEMQSLITGEMTVLNEAKLFDYGDQGKTLSLQKFFYNQEGVNIHVNVDVDRLDGIQLRHKIKIGTDLSKWESIKKESNHPEEIFKRIYLLVQNRGEKGRMMGLSFYEGSMIIFDYEGLVDNDTIDKLKNITWGASKRHSEVYNNSLKEISEGPLFRDDPILTRSDLPDPDLEKRTNE